MESFLITPTAVGGIVHSSLHVVKPTQRPRIPQPGEVGDLSLQPTRPNAHPHSRNPPTGAGWGSFTPAYKAERPSPIPESPNRCRLGIFHSSLQRDARRLLPGVHPNPQPAGCGIREARWRSLVGWSEESTTFPVVGLWRRVGRPLVGCGVKDPQLADWGIAGGAAQRSAFCRLE
jgi:hypothetical protein